MMKILRKGKQKEAFQKIQPQIPHKDKKQWIVRHSLQFFHEPLLEFFPFVHYVLLEGKKNKIRFHSLHFMPWRPF